MLLDWRDRSTVAFMQPSGQVLPERHAGVNRLLGALRWLAENAIQDVGRRHMANLFTLSGEKRNLGGDGRLTLGEELRFQLGPQLVAFGPSLLFEGGPKRWGPVPLPSRINRDV